MTCGLDIRKARGRRGKRRVPVAFPKISRPPSRQHLFFGQWECHNISPTLDTIGVFSHKVGPAVLTTDGI
jgi:hypothetical protein